MKLPKNYEPHLYQEDIYDLWEKSGAFSPSGTGRPYSIILPPPNANAGLHVGHTLLFAIQDTLIRYHRMKGERVLWAPGADHAGFETQVVYEKHLAKEGKSRFDFSRDELYAQIYEFVGQNKQNFEEMFRDLGASVDWSRFTFTLDDNVVKNVYATFKKMWTDGLIYRGERLVNYCTQHRTGFADIEVEYQEKESPLYYLKYGPFELATTRPETKFGDTAIAVHPEDERYQQYVGKVLSVEGLNGPFEIRVVADEMVDRSFGTGVVKITPAHDFNDWEVAKRHNLEAVRVINHDGTLNHRAGKYEGLNVAEARKQVVADLKEKGLLVRIDENYKNRVGTCYKCGTTIEPMLMDQWFISMEKLAKPAIESLEKKEIKFYPEAKRQQIIDYLKNVKDWNISRQIAWGIPIPAFQNVDDPDDWIFNEAVGEEIIEVDGKNYRRDPDVFDTWFSSGHWPFVTLGYPDSQDFKDFYPNSVMETGLDILYQWVARMICIGLYVTGNIPFKEVYLHGMVRSEDGTKMSKSKGNVVDPVAVLKENGADALRLGMIAGRSAGLSAAYAPSKIVTGRNFCNKLWNIARYCEFALGDDYSVTNLKPSSVADHWILNRLNQTTQSISKLLDEYRFSEAYEILYHFIWDDFADWYIEASKAELNKSVLAYVLEASLKLTHPFAPFVSETIYQTLSWTGDRNLISESWPETKETGDNKAAQDFQEIIALVGEVRRISQSLDVNKPVLGYKKSSLLDQNKDLVCSLAKLADCEPTSDKLGISLSNVKLECWLVVDEKIAKEYKDSLVSQLDKLETEISRLKARLSNKSYVNNAPKELVEQTKSQLEEAEVRLAKLEKEIKDLN